MNNEMIEVNKAVAEFDRVAAGLADLETKYKDVVFDVSTSSGMAVAKSARAEIREPRYEVEKIRKSAKAPILALGKHLDSEAARITLALEAIENPIDSVIKAEEQRIAAEKAEKARIEAERVAGIQLLIANIRNIPQQFVNASAEDIQMTIDLTAATDIALDQYAEFTGEAMQAKAQTISALADLLTNAQEREAEQLRMAAEREELNRLRAEQVERDRVAAEQRAQTEAAERAEREAYEKKVRAEQVAEQQAARERIAEMERQQAEIDRQRRELEEQQRATAHAEADRIAAAAREKQEKAEAKAKAKREQEERKAREQFMQVGPDPKEIISLVAEHYGVEESIAINWLSRHEFGDLLAA